MSSVLPPGKAAMVKEKTNAYRRSFVFTARVDRGRFMSFKKNVTSFDENSSKKIKNDRYFRNGCSPLEIVVVTFHYDRVPP